MNPINVSNNPYSKNFESYAVAPSKENNKGKVISKGKLKNRLFLSGLPNKELSEIGRRLAPAIKLLSSKIAQQVNKAPKLGLIQRQFYLPVLVQAKGDDTPVWVLVNKASFIKRFEVDKKAFNKELKQASTMEAKQALIQKYINEGIQREQNRQTGSLNADPNDLS
ncbi:MAG: hypothetical protein ACSNEK_06280 [Parachlamydiaceae bacterium]